MDAVGAGERVGAGNPEVHQLGGRVVPTVLTVAEQPRRPSDDARERAALIADVAPLPDREPAERPGAARVVVGAAGEQTDRGGGHERLDGRRHLHEGAVAAADEVVETDRRVDAAELDRPDPRDVAPHQPRRIEVEFAAEHAELEVVPDGTDEVERAARGQVRAPHVDVVRHVLDPIALARMRPRRRSA